MELEANVSYLLQPDGSYLTQGVLRELTDRPTGGESAPVETAPGAGVDLTVTAGTPPEPALDTELLNQLNNDLAYARSNISDLVETVKLGNQLLGTVREFLEAKSDNVRRVCVAQMGPLLEENEVVFDHADKSLKAVLEGLERVTNTLHDLSDESKDRSAEPAVASKSVKLD